MRWENLLVERDQGDARELVNLPLFGEQAVVRRFNTPEFKGATFYEVKAKSIINHVPGDRFGFNRTINPYRGCGHACVYCFARPTHTYLDLNAGEDFESQIVVKVNAVELLQRELRKPTWRGEHIAMGTNTDPYQRAEGHYKLMRGILGALNEVRNPYSILTKGTLIKRDIDLLSEGARVTDVSTAFSIGSVDEAVWKATEPGTPHPMKRMEVVRQLNDSGVPCGVMIAAIIPGVSDHPDQLKATVEAAAAAGATFVTPIVLHLRPGVREEFISWLQDEYPQLVVPYEQMYKRSNAPKAVTEPITKTVAALKRKYLPDQVVTARAMRRADSEPEVHASPRTQEQLAFSLDMPDRPPAPRWVKERLG